MSGKLAGESQGVLLVWLGGSSDGGHRCATGDEQKHRHDRCYDLRDPSPVLVAALAGVEDIGCGVVYGQASGRVSCPAVDGVSHGEQASSPVQVGRVAMVAVPRAGSASQAARTGIASRGLLHPVEQVDRLG
ncbi:hypothetical protein I0C86_03160 [Plantactinospora sp. S1510]|uniref:Uncharacterized protein n=1 Tax=Plantactinospora alkalitolerans TaxID=2789879 RepID=A0ABS0GP79_9ACTN|nr:hypothetical protein [Plantactinospora alkalitolerans]